jgi:hypothetical protein
MDALALAVTLAFAITLAFARPVRLACNHLWRVHAHRRLRLVRRYEHLCLCR